MECGRVAGVGVGAAMELTVLPRRTFLLLPQRAVEPTERPRPDDRVAPLLHGAQMIATCAIEYLLLTEVD